MEQEKLKRKQARHSASKKAKRKILLAIFIIIFVIGIVGLSVYLYRGYKDKQDNQNILSNIQVDQTEITEEKTERMLQVEELQKENSDILRLD